MADSAMFYSVRSLKDCGFNILNHKEVLCRKFCAGVKYGGIGAVRSGVVVECESCS